MQLDTVVSLDTYIETKNYDPYRIPGELHLAF